MIRKSGFGAVAVCMATGVFGSDTASAEVISFWLANPNPPGDTTTGEVLNALQAVTSKDVPEVTATNLTITASTVAGGWMTAGTGTFGVYSGPPDSDQAAFNSGDWFVFSFNLPVEITLFDFDAFSGNERAEITIATPEPKVLTVLGGNVYNSGGSGASKYTPTEPVIVPANTNITLKDVTDLSLLSNPNWELQAITLTVVPEPATLGLVVAGGLLMLRRRRG